MSGPLPWEKDAPLAARWTDLAYDLLVAGELTAVIRVHGEVSVEMISGPCPRCHDRFAHSAPRAGVSDRVGVLAHEHTALPSDWVFVDLWCECTEFHPERPEGRSGCGVGFRVPARIERS